MSLWSCAYSFIKHLIDFKWLSIIHLESNVLNIHIGLIWNGLRIQANFFTKKKALHINRTFN